MAEPPHLPGPPPAPPVVVAAAPAAPLGAAAATVAPATAAATAPVSVGIVGSLHGACYHTCVCHICAARDPAAKPTIHLHLQKLLVPPPGDWLHAGQP